MMRDETKMDANRLISEVYKRPALWNQRHISYHNRDVTNRIWMEIAALFKLPKQVLKTKWKGLRDTFRAEIKKEQVYRKSNYTPNRPVWIHFKTLQFLKEQMLPRPPIWERGDKSGDNDKTSAGASENSCDNKIGASEGLSDLALVLVDSNDRRQVSLDTTITKDNRRRRKRTGSNSQQQQTAGRNDDALRAAAAGDDVNAETRKSDVTRIQNRSDNRNRNNNNNKRHSNNSNKNISNSQDERINPVKEEPVDNYEDNVEEFGKETNEMNNLDGNNCPMVENMPSDEILMPETTGENYVIAGHLAIDPLEGNRFDDNYYFFMSLLPHIRSLPAERRMLLRMQMQQLVYQEVYNRNGGHSSLDINRSNVAD